jgi:hypothetical protein
MDPSLHAAMTEVPRTAAVPAYFVDNVGHARLKQREHNIKKMATKSCRSQHIYNKEKRREQRKATGTKKSDYNKEKQREHTAVCGPLKVGQ